MKKVISLLLSVIMLLSITAGLDFSAIAETNPTDIVSISAGYDLSTAVRADGSVWTWGGNSIKNLGLAVGTSTNSPTMICSKNAESAKCSHYYGFDYSSNNNYYTQNNSAILKNDGSLWMYGTGRFGSQGNDNSNYQKPHKVLETVVDYDVAGAHSAAVTYDGKLYMWGYNKFGQIGNNSTESVYSPTEVLSNVVSVSLSRGYESNSTGNGHSAAITSDGSLYMWGCNRYGQLGDGTTEDSYVPKKITDNVKQVSLGESFTVVLKKDGTVWTCGENDKGQLAKGTTQGYTTDMTTHYSNGATIIDDMWPTNVPDSDKVLSKVVDLEDYDVRSIEAGFDNAAALTSNGFLLMWGGNSNGKLGNGYTSNNSNPSIVMSSVKSVALGFAHTIAVKIDNSIWTWGYNYWGQLGDGTTTSQKKPIEITLGRLKADFKAGSKTNSLNVFLDDAYYNKNATIFNKDLSIDGIVLSEAAYSNSKVIEQFGYSIVVNGMSNNGIDKPGFLIGYKVMYDYDEPRVEIIMAIRGTKSIASADAITDVKSVRDGFNKATDYCYEQLTSAKSKISSNLGLLGLSMAKKNTKYFLVGHSLGGACAGKLALRMNNDGFAYSNNIYCYTYAAPNYTNINEKMDSVVDYLGIHNVINIADTVPRVPTMMWYFEPFWGITLYKAGTSYNYSTSANLSSFNSIIYDLYDEIPWDTFLPLKSHMTSTYYALLKCTQSTGTSFSNYLIRLLSVHCPVDVEVYDGNGELCGYSRGEDVTYPNLSAVRITVVDDEKYIELPDESYTVKYIGTDSGTMKVEDQLINVESSEVESEKVFEGVVLEEGKQFESVIDAEDTDKTDLYVVDSDGDKISSVDVNGAETDLYTYDITEHNIQISTDSYKYDGTAKTQTVSVEGLTEGTDYRVIYDNNIAVGTATVTVKGINDYYGRESKTFKIYDEGTCSETVSWKLSPSGTLTITGTGEIPNYDNEAPAPWSAHKETISKIVINDGVTAIGNNAFAGCEEASEIYIPSSVTAIGENATDGCSKLTSITYTGTSDEWNEITVGEGNTVVENTEKTYSSTESGHIWDNGVITKTATCSAEGEMTYTCTECGTTKTEPVAKVAHSYETKITQPTCTAKGYTTYTCLECGNTYVSDYVNAKEHTVVVDAAVPATYTSEGKTEGKHCSVCGTVLVAQQTVAKLAKKDNTLSVKAKKPTVKLAKLKKKNQTIAAKKAVTVSGAQGKVTFKKAKGNKKITVAKNGKITVKKGLKKGKYKIRITVNAAGNNEYNPASKTVTVTVIVK